MKKDRGQFIILAAIALITAILVVAATATNSGFRIRQSQEFLVSIPLMNALDDGYRALIVALSRASWTYNASSYDYVVANNTAYLYLLDWTKNFSEAHGGRGVNAYITSDVDFQWSDGTIWWSNSSGLLIVNAPSAGIPELRVNLAAGVILFDLTLINNGFNITAFDLYRNVGVSVRLISLKINDSPVISWDYQYFGFGLNGYYNINIPPPISKIEAYFEYNGILVRVIRIYKSS